MTAHRLRNFFLSFFLSLCFFLLFIYLLRRNKLNIVSNDFNQLQVSHPNQHQVVSAWCDDFTQIIMLIAVCPLY
jgi:multisubunit Na+/H+ antiporter MnhB subunit